jgi:hypothetical protein
MEIPYEKFRNEICVKACGPNHKCHADDTKVERCYKLLMRMDENELRTVF